MLLDENPHNTMLAIGIFAIATGRPSRGEEKVTWALLLVLFAVASSSFRNDR
jgi:hypothetical protein